MCTQARDRDKHAPGLSGESRRHLGIIAGGLSCRVASLESIDETR